MAEYDQCEEPRWWEVPQENQSVQLPTLGVEIPDDKEPAPALGGVPPTQSRAPLPWEPEFDPSKMCQPPDEEQQSVDPGPQRPVENHLGVVIPDDKEPAPALGGKVEPPDPFDWFGY
jgi:hypothetical protein